MKVWDVTAGAERMSLSGHILPVLGVAFSPDGERLASSSGKMKDVDDSDIFRGALGEIKVWNLGTGKETLAIRAHNLGAHDVAFTPDGKRLASAGRSLMTGEVKLWDSMTGQEVLTLQGGFAAFRVAFSRDGKRLAAATAAFPFGGQKTGQVKLWNAICAE
ncbi:MAG: hypothetical protein HY000_35265 [Planctomycetes bacterium]|nr:hypothetical protein [Planctomycetota bacterium]